MFLIEAVDDGLVADSAHERHKDLKIPISTADLLFKSRLQERIEFLNPDVWLTLAVHDAEEVEFVHFESQLRILLKTFFLSVHVILVLEVNEDVVLHQEAPVKTLFVIKHQLKMVISGKCNLQLLQLDSGYLTCCRDPVGRGDFEHKLLKPIFEFL